MNFEGIIIEESLADTKVLQDVEITSTQIEPVTEKHKTPWVKQWTLHAVKVPPEDAKKIARQISRALDKDHNWYADFKTETEHYVIYTDKVFHITDRSDLSQYSEATRYGVSIGIPEYQVDFSPHIRQWER